MMMIEYPFHNLLLADHPSNTKRGGVCIYYNANLSIIKRNDLCHLYGCLVSELRTEKENCFFTCIYSFTIQTTDEFEDFFTDINYSCQILMTLIQHIPLSLEISMLDLPYGEIWIRKIRKGVKFASLLSQSVIVN